MPFDSVLERIHVVTDEAKHDLVVQERYEAPAGPDGQPIFDDYRGYDKWAADRAMALLKTVYPGHFWAVECDARQGVMFISIPILMGFLYKFIIHLAHLTPHAVVEAGGQILERYRLPRAAFTDAFFEARARFSPLANARNRAVPE